MSKLKYNIALIAANTIYGANYSFYSSLIGHYISSEELYVLRCLTSAIIFIPLLFLTNNYKIQFRDLYKFTIVAALLVFGRQYLVLKGMNYASPIDGSIIATTGPIMIMLISAIMIKERITWRRALGITLGGAGAILLVVSNMRGGSVSGKMLGNILLVASILFSSINTVFVKKLFIKYSPYTVIGWAYIISLLFVIPLFGKNLTEIDFTNWTPAVYGSMAYLLIFGSAIAAILFFYGLRGVSATASSIYVYIQPVVGTLLAILRGQDKITVITVCSASLIFAGVFFVIRSYRNTPSTASPVEMPH